MKKLLYQLYRDIKYSIVTPEAFARPEYRRLSGRYMVLEKYVHLIFVLGFLRNFKSVYSMLTHGINWFLVFVMGVYIYLVFFIFLQYKTVFVSDDQFFILDFLGNKMTTLKFCDLYDVSGSVFLAPDMVRLTYLSNGKKQRVYFRGKGRILTFLTEHPLVGEIRKMMNHPERKLNV